MAKKIIEAYKGGKGDCPWRVRIDGKTDPRNRDFKDVPDIRDTFAALQEAGFYEGYEIIVQR